MFSSRYWSLNHRLGWLATLLVLITVLAVWTWHPWLHSSHASTHLTRTPPHVSAPVSPHPVPVPPSPSSLPSDAAATARGFYMGVLVYQDTDTQAKLRDRLAPFAETGLLSKLVAAPILSTPVHEADTPFIDTMIGSGFERDRSISIKGAIASTYDGCKPRQSSQDEIAHGAPRQYCAKRTVSMTVTLTPSPDGWRVTSYSSGGEEVQK